MRVANFQFPIAKSSGPLPYGRGTDGSLRASVPTTRPKRERCPRQGPCLRAFSLVEMMIAIVILGLGLVMVATMFPVAWDRARDLSEHTIEQSAASAAQATIEAVVRSAGVTLRDDDGDPATPAKPFINSGSFAGDMFYDQLLTRIMLGNPAGVPNAYHGIVLYSDTRVHALHMENILAGDGTVVREHPWKLEGVWNFVDNDHPSGSGDIIAFSDAFATGPPDDLRESGSSFYFPQVRVAQRMHGPVDGRPLDTDTTELTRWNDRLASRRFCWAVLHRLREAIGPPCETQQSPECFFPYLGTLCPTATPPAPRAGRLSDSESLCITSLAEQGAGATRSFDGYYVTLRRPQSTHRYARQDPAAVPNPYALDSSDPAVPVAALPIDDDVLLPVAWRVQVQLPATLPYRTSPVPTMLPTGVPTEVTVPPTGLSSDTARLVVSMFPQGTQFIDEITGLVFRVTKRRIVDALGAQAVLTLDREIAQEDIDIFELGVERRVRCEACTGTPTTPSNPPDAEELRRTVWVFPPPADRSADPAKPIFDGPSPVVGIEVRSLSVAP